MQKEIKEKVKAAIRRGGKILQRRAKKKKVLLAAGGIPPTRALAKLRKIRENFREKRKEKKKVKIKKQKALKLWNKSFEGSFHYAMKDTADFLKKGREKRRSGKRCGKPDYPWG